MGFVESYRGVLLIDLEKTLLETCRQSREDSRLLFGMRGWLLKHHDLVNGSRLIRLVKMEGDTAILGAVIDSVIEQAPYSTLRYVRKYCQKARKSEFVFRRIKDSPVQAEINRNGNLPVWRKWNLISREMDDLKGAIRNKSYVFHNNLNLSLRALFGSILRADLLNYFIEHSEGNAHEIANALEQSYQPVYSEIQSFREMGWMEEKRVGMARVFHIKTPVRRKLLALATAA